eukprot:scaffold200058_cov21-Tisochrysis_lutea.AAC.1
MHALRRELRGKDIELAGGVRRKLCTLALVWGQVRPAASPLGNMIKQYMTGAACIACIVCMCTGRGLLQEGSAAAPGTVSPWHLHFRKCWLCQSSSLQRFPQLPHSLRPVVSGVGFKMQVRVPCNHDA